MTAVSAALAHAAAGEAARVRRLAELVAIPSVSADQARRRDVLRAADWLVGELRRVGMRHATRVRTSGHPVVFAEWCEAPRAPTLLIYGHYDVVGADPVAQWRTPPFRPMVRGGFLYGRGSSDDKGPLLCHLGAIEAWLRAHGRLPVNVRCVFEGEEEIGSPHLWPVLKRAAGRGVDAAVISDTRMLDARRPALIIGLRGSLAAELEIRGASRDLHSGAFGGAVLNPAQVLCELVAGLHDARGRIAIPGFYDAVRPRDRRGGTSVQTRAGEAMLQAAGGALASGEAGYSAFERTTVRPALDISGLHAGHTGAGVKSIVPARATAKLAFRLAPDQDPHRVGQALRAVVTRRCPPGAQARLELSKATSPVALNVRTPALEAARRALHAGFGVPPVILRSGGTIPVVAMLAHRLGIPVALMGFARPDDGMHGPNERTDLAVLAAGTRTCIHFLDLLATGARTRRAEAPRARAMVG